MAKHKADDERRLDNYNSDSSRNIRAILLFSTILGAIALITAIA